mgnify:FL=1
MYPEESRALDGAWEALRNKENFTLDDVGALLKKEHELHIVVNHGRPDPSLLNAQDLSTEEGRDAAKIWYSNKKHFSLVGLDNMKKVLHLKKISQNDFEAQVESTKKWVNLIDRILGIL